MALVTRFEDLRAWGEARRLAAKAYEQSRLRRFAGDRELADQLRRAAVSAMNNIAEGFDSGTGTEFRRFLRYAIRSASEVQSCLYVALDQQYIDRSEFEVTYQLADSVKRLCGAFVRRLGSYSVKKDSGGGQVKDEPAEWHSRTSAPPYTSTAAPQHRNTRCPAR